MRNASLALLVIATLVTTANGEPRGFTAGIGAATGVTRLTSNAITPNTTEMGAGYSATAGAFVRDDLAVAAHVNVLFALADDTLDGTGANVAFGAIAQYWPATRLSVFAGPGYSVAAYKRKMPTTVEQALGTDGGFTPLLGASVYPFRDRGWHASFETTPLITGDGIVAITAGISVGWQYVRR
jgi:hypothetical protein